MPAVLVLLVTRTRWWRERKRIRWAGERPLWLRDSMDRLPPPFGDYPPPPKRGRRR